MSRTYRRKNWYPKVKGVLGNKCYRDASCSPGCSICGKDKTTKRAEKRGNNQDAMKQEIKDSD